MKRWIVIAVVLFSLGGAGCAKALHELQPHRLWRLNYTDPPGRSESPYFND